MRYLIQTLLIITTVFFGSITVHAEDSSSASPITISLIQEETAQEGKSFWVALHVQLEKDWHVYWKNPGDAGIPLSVEWTLPNGFQSGPLLWPSPEKFENNDLTGFGYHDEVILLTQITSPSTIDKNQKKSITAKIDWLACSPTTCQPGSILIDKELKIADALESSRVDLEAAKIFEKARKKIPQQAEGFFAARKGAKIHVEIPYQDKRIQKISFFPEWNDFIDLTSDPVVRTDHAAKTSFVELKVKEDASKKEHHKSLQGILVLHIEKEGQPQHLAIDHPIEEGHELLSYLDSSHMTTSGQNQGSDSVALSYKNFSGGLGLALLFAFMGGLILNLMPCVLPIISIKLLGLVNMAGQRRSLSIRHGLLFSAGVICSFWLLASAMYMLRLYGQTVGWGFQLQEPLFVAILASILYLFSLNLFGLFEWGTSVASWAGQVQANTQKLPSEIGSFCSGILATVVATPCTGPFLGSAVGFAMSLPFGESLLIFTFLAAGMCAPYQLISFFPSLFRFLPKPGRWMEIFKQFMGFTLLATVLWLLWVFSAQTDAMSLIYLLAGFFFFALGAWLYGIGCSPLSSRFKRIVTYAFVFSFAFIGFQAIASGLRSAYTSQSTPSSSQEWDGWEKFSPERVAQLQKEGKPFIIDFTAKWCLICQANHLVLSSEEVSKQFEGLGVVKLKADWTKSDPQITEELSKYGRNSVPLYVLDKGDEQEPTILPQVLTTDALLDHLEQIPSKEIALQ